MPLGCKNSRYRWKTTSSGKKVRLGFCGDKVVETKKKGGQAKHVRRAKRKPSKGRSLSGRTK